MEYYINHVKIHVDTLPIFAYVPIYSDLLLVCVRIKNVDYINMHTSSDQ